jgi:hypothetical protein
VLVADGKGKARGQSVIADETRVLGIVSQVRLEGEEELLCDAFVETNWRGRGKSMVNSEGAVDISRVQEVKVNHTKGSIVVSMNVTCSGSAQQRVDVAKSDGDVITTMQDSTVWIVAMTVIGALAVLLAIFVAK